MAETVFQPIRYQALRHDRSPCNTDTSQSTSSILIAAEKPDAGCDFRLQAKGNSEGSWVDGGVQQFTPLCVLSVGLTANRFFEDEVELGGDVGGLNSYTPEEVRSGLGLLLVSSVSGFEWISYESVVQHGSGSATISTVNRGLFGTTGSPGWRAGLGSE